MFIDKVTHAININEMMRFIIAELERVKNSLSFTAFF